jgi:hypothetical protein
MVPATAIAWCSAGARAFTSRGLTQGSRVVADNRPDACRSNISPGATDGGPGTPTGENLG